MAGVVIEFEEGEGEAFKGMGGRSATLSIGLFSWVGVEEGTSCSEVEESSESSLGCVSTFGQRVSLIQDTIMPIFRLLVG